MLETWKSIIATTGVSLLILAFIVYLAKKNKKKRITIPERINAAGVIFATLLGIAAFDLSDAQAVETAREMKKQTDVFAHQAATMDRQLADMRGQINFQANRTEDWRLTLKPIGPPGSPPISFELIPLFERPDGTFSEGDIVPLAGANYTLQQGDRWVIEIPNAKQVVCDR